MKSAGTITASATTITSIERHQENERRECVWISETKRKRLLIFVKFAK